MRSFNRCTCRGRHDRFATWPAHWRNFTELLEDGGGSAGSEPPAPCGCIRHITNGSTLELCNRVRLCELSRQHPQLVDAKLAYIPESYETMPGGQDLRLDWCTPPSPESFQDLCYGCSEDGSTIDDTRIYWMLSTGSLVFKQITPLLGFGITALEPMVHFVPIKEDLSDLVEKLHWARAHDEICGPCTRLRTELLHRGADLALHLASDPEVLRRVPVPRADAWEPRMEMEKKQAVQRSKRAARRPDEARMRGGTRSRRFLARIQFLPEVRGRYGIADLVSETQVKSMADQPLTVSTTGSLKSHDRQVYVAGARLTKVNIRCWNGYELRDKDKRERDELHERIMEKERQSKKRVASSSAGDTEGPGRSFEFSNEEERREAIDHIRLMARRKYLGEREVKISDLRGRQVSDAEWLMKGEKLSEAEQQYLKLERDLYDERGLERPVGYNMPDVYDDDDQKGQNKRFAVLEQRYQQTYDEILGFRVPVWKWEKNEEQRLEDATVSKAVTKYGAQKGRKENKEKTQYDLILEDAVEFGEAEVVGGNFKAPTLEEGPKAESSDEDEKEQVFKKLKKEADNLQKDRKSLPVYLYKAPLLEAVRDYQVLIIVGETGSGKTTQIPPPPPFHLRQYLHEVGYSKIGKIGCTQPRRVAAMSVAARVAKEYGCKSSHTEERTLHTDVLFGLVKDVARFRQDLKLIISSATLDAEKFSEYFDNAPIFNVPGRRFPVSIHYTKAPEANYLDACVITVLQIHLTQGPGDVLVFFTGQQEIEEAMDLLSFKTRGMGTTMGELLVLPIYANLPTDMQAKIFEATPPGARKVVLATNIAETSITIDNIVFVIDPGFCKQNSFNPRTGMENITANEPQFTGHFPENPIMPGVLQVEALAQLAGVVCMQPGDQVLFAGIDGVKFRKPVVPGDTLVMEVEVKKFREKVGIAKITGAAYVDGTKVLEVKEFTCAPAGSRVKPGKCFRLFTKWSYEHELDDDNAPEIQRSNLGHVVLMLKSIGIDDLLHFDFMDPPPPETLIKALEQLYALSALNDQGDLTKLGRRMAEFPMDPQQSKSLIQADKYKCVDEVVTICSMLGVDGAIFYRPKDKGLHADNARKNFHKPGGDHMTMLHVYKQWEETGFSLNWCMENYLQNRSLKRARDIREQLVDMLEKVEIEHSSNVNDVDGQRKSILSGFFYNTARLRKDGSYVTVKHPHTVEIHPTSSLFGQQPRLVCYHELVLTTKEFMRGCIEVKPEWLLEVAPHFYQSKERGETAGSICAGVHLRRSGSPTAQRVMCTPTGDFFASLPDAKPRATRWSRKEEKPEGREVRKVYTLGTWRVSREVGYEWWGDRLGEEQMEDVEDLLGVADHVDASNLYSRWVTYFNDSMAREKQKRCERCSAEQGRWRCGRSKQIEEVLQREAKALPVLSSEQHAQNKAHSAKDNSRDKSQLYVSEKMDSWSRALMHRVEHASESVFNAIWFNHYRDGTVTIHWHSDGNEGLGPDPIIASLSLGATRDFAFKSKREWRGLRKANDGSMFHSNNIIHITLPLFHGSLCVMGKNSQRHWLHAVPAMEGIHRERTNLTFRFWALEGFETIDAAEAQADTQRQFRLRLTPSQRLAQRRARPVILDAPRDAKTTVEEMLRRLENLLPPGLGEVVLAQTEGDILQNDQPLLDELESWTMKGHRCPALVNKALHSIEADSAGLQLVREVQLSCPGAYAPPHGDVEVQANGASHWIQEVIQNLSGIQRKSKGKGRISQMVYHQCSEFCALYLARPKSSGYYEV
eukprot:g19708.t1